MLLRYDGVSNAGRDRVCAKNIPAESMKHEAAGLGGLIFGMAQGLSGPACGSRHHRVFESSGPVNMLPAVTPAYSDL